MPTPLALTVPDDAWQPVGGDDDPRTRLLTSIVINGTSLHLEAWEIEAGADPQTTRIWSYDFDSLAATVGAEGPFQTTQIAGRTYVLLATPYCN